jgi:peptide/nickel transport system substrate-binding protein
MGYPVADVISLTSGEIPRWAETSRDCSLQLIIRRSLVRVQAGPSQASGSADGLVTADSRCDRHRVDSERRLAEQPLASYHRSVGLRRPALVALGVVSALALGAADSVPGTAANSGGTLSVLTSVQSLPPLDPAVMPVSWGPLWYATCATLTAFQDAPAPAGLTVRPEAADGPPEISRDGKTYAFTVRKGLRFSDGSPLMAKNFAHALGRVLHPDMRSGGASLFSDVEDVLSSGRRLIIKLKKRTGTLAMRLALPFACPVPLGLPKDPAGVDSMVGSGPYYFSDYDPGRRLTFERNPYYRGSRPRMVDRVVLRNAGDLDTNIRAVAEARAEVLGSEIPREMREEIARRYGVNKRQYFQTPGASIRTIVLNTSRPLFRKNPALRKAVNLALDRVAIMRASGTPSWYEPTDQILTRWMPAWIDERLYAARPNLRLARSLAEGHLRGGKAVLYTAAPRFGSLAVSLDQANVIVRNLNEIGLDVDVKTFSLDVLDASVSTAGEPYDMYLGGFDLRYPDPADVIIRFLAGENARKPAGNSNYAYFDVPVYNRRMAAADRLTGAARSRAFSKLDADIMRNAPPWAPLFEGASTLLVSKRVGCLEMHPVFRIDFGAMCLR